jgi:hypothetical protein
VTRRNPAGIRARERRWIVAGFAAWVPIGTFAGELRDPPFDLVRFLFRLLVGGLMAWLLVWLFNRPFLRRGND